MKRLAILIALLVTANRAYAQQDYMELLRSDIAEQKRALVAQSMNLSGDQSEAFWNVYNEYEKERMKLGDRRIEIIKEYAANYTTMTDQVADGLMDRIFQVDRDLLSLREKYYGKTKDAVNPIVAARFLQVENKIGLLLDLQISSEIPLVTKGWEQPESDQD